MRDLVLKEQAFDDLKFWSVNDTKILRKIFDLPESITRDPFEGIRKPEALKGNLKGYWSRRINEEHRVVYSVTEKAVIVISCRSHYKT